MKKVKVLIAILAIVVISPTIGLSQISIEKSERTFKMNDSKKWRLSGTADGSMLQMAILEFGGEQQFSGLRYSLFFNTGLHLNKSIGKNLTFFTGANFKNLGFIYRTDDLVQKYRSYTLGAPLGLKIGNLNEGYLIAGGGVDFPFHTKKKQWTKGDRATKIKNEEWFSEEVNPVLAYGFLGYRFKNSFTAKLMYYPTNYWSDSFIQNNRSNIFVLTLGFDLGKNSTGKAMELGTRSRLNDVNP